MAACVREKSFINLADAYQDPRFDPAHDKSSGYKTSSILCVPISAIDGSGKIVGAVQFLNKKDGKGFTEADQRAAEMLARHVSIFLDDVLDD